MPGRYAAVLLMVMVLTASGCTSGPPLVGGPAPDFSATTLAGQELSLNGLKGRPVILYFFASW